MKKELKKIIEKIRSSRGMKPEFRKGCAIYELITLEDNGDIMLNVKLCKENTPEAIKKVEDIENFLTWTAYVDEIK